MAGIHYQRKQGWIYLAIGSLQLFSFFGASGWIALSLPWLFERMCSEVKRRSAMRMRAVRIACVLALLAFGLFDITAHAQGVANLYMAGGSYSAGATPAFSGSGLYAHCLGAVGTCPFTMIDALPNTTKPFTVTTNVAVGVAQRVVSIAGYAVMVPTAAGISYTGTNTGWAWSTGVGVPVPLPTKSGGWYVMPTVRVLKSSVSSGTGYQPIVGVLIGWGR